MYLLMGNPGFEPECSYEQQILSLRCLPIPPIALYFIELEFFHSPFLLEWLL